MSEKNTISQRITLDGAKEVEALLDSIAKAGEAMATKLKDALNKVSPNLGNKLAADVAAVESAGSRMAGALSRVELATINLQTRFVGFREALSNVVERVGVFVGAISAAAAGVLEFAKSTDEAIIEASNQAQALGLTIQQYSGLQNAAQDSGVGADLFATAMNHLNKAMNETAAASSKVGKSFVEINGKTIELQRGSDAAANATGATANAFTKLGVAARDANGELRPTNDVLFDLADKFSKMPDGAKKSALALELFGGKTGSELLPFLNKGAVGIKEFIELTDKYGARLTDAQVASAHFADDGLAKIKLALDGIRIAVGTALDGFQGDLFPIIADFIASFRPLLAEVARDAANQVELFVIDVIRLFNGWDSQIKNRWLISLRDAVVSAGQILLLVIEALDLAFQLASNAADTLAGAINRMFGTNISGQGLLLAAVVLQLSGAFRLLFSAANLVLGAFNVGLAVFRSMTVAASVLAPAIEIVIEGMAALAAGAAGALSVPVLVIAAIAAAVAAAGVAIYLYWDQIKAGAADAWDYVKDKSNEAWEFIANQWQNPQSGFNTFVADAKALASEWVQDIAAAAAKVYQALISAYQDPAKFAAEFFDAIKNAWAALWDAIESMATAGMGAVVSAVQSAVNAIVSAIEAARSALSALKGSADQTNSGGGNATTFAGGGFVSGPGSGTSDSIPAWLSNGEFVIRAAAVKKLGLGLLQALNSGRFTLEQILGLKGLKFALGGLVPPAPGAQRFAAGGPVIAPGGQGGHAVPLILNIGGAEFEASATNGEAWRLEQHLRNRRGLSLGRRP